ncbi:MAG: 16S rRNA (uracil(1498)-N(3))-methyltransferase [Anaerolineaceae bacterium]|nr:16S rRNA (uracil(1498)-N(3))-methyltransferase [Anaerolineaceae bacterium]
MNRFFVEPERITESSVMIPDEVSAQIRKVLRLKEGTHVQFLDNTGWIYESAIHYLDEKNLTAEIIEKKLAAGEPHSNISLYIGLTQREKFEWILQKCTEAGVGKIVPMITERSLIRKASDISGKRDRWEKILKEAAEQCGRGLIPVLGEPMTYREAVQKGASADAALFCWEGEKQTTLREILEPFNGQARNISILIGPEGGFSEEEAEYASNYGWRSVSLGKRIYRMETAAIASVILSLYELER